MPHSIRGRHGSAVVGVVTVIPEEFEAVRGVMSATTALGCGPYLVRQARDDKNYSVVVTKSDGKTNLPCRDATQELIEDFRPPYILLAGIAGGLQDQDIVQLGDVIIADYIVYSEYLKLTHDRHLRRLTPHDQPSYYLRRRVAESIKYSEQWQDYIDEDRPDAAQPHVKIGNVVAGEKLLGDPEAVMQQELLQRFDNALAVDMESYGFARAIYLARSSIHYNPQGLVIRSVSDIVHDDNNQATRDQWRNYAATTAAAFARAITDSLLLDITSNNNGAADQ